VLCVGQAEVDSGGGRAPVDLGEFVVGPGEADLESFDFAEPAFAFGFSDAGDQVVADFGNALALSGIGGSAWRRQPCASTSRGYPRS
jgi:hypothetical protein